MIPGSPAEAGWTRQEPRRALSPSVLEQIVKAAFPRCHVFDAEPLGDGLRNSNFKLSLNSAAEPVVLRIYEHDVSLCQKELDLFRLLRGSVPVPDVLHAEPHGLDAIPPFMLTRYVEGISYRELRRSGDMDAIAQAAYSAGETLAAIGRTTFRKAGWIAPGPTVGSPLLEGEDSHPRFVDLCLASTNLQKRLPADLRILVHKVAWAAAPEFASLEETVLVHGDFNKRNLLVRRDGGRWKVVAVLDWEFALSGSPLCDFGNFLRYEPASRPLAEPHFSTGYLHAGGTLPRDWRRLARLVDLVALCESLTRDQLPIGVASELAELVRATVENRDPQPP